jgi:hypothetical protein
LIEAGPSGDLDSDLRVALLAIWGSADHQLAGDFLRQSGDMKMQSIDATELKETRRNARLAGFPPM